MANKRHTMQARNLYREDPEVFAKNEGKEKLYVEGVLKNGDYKLRKGVDERGKRVGRGLRRDRSERQGVGLEGMYRHSVVKLRN